MKKVDYFSSVFSSFFASSFSAFLEIFAVFVSFAEKEGVVAWRLDLTFAVDASTIQE